MGHLLLEHLKGWPLEGVLQKNFFFFENALSGSIHSTYQLASMQTDQIPTLGQPMYNRLWNRRIDLRHYFLLCSFSKHGEINSRLVHSPAAECAHCAGDVESQKVWNLTLIFCRTPENNEVFKQRQRTKDSGLEETPTMFSLYFLHYLPLLLG